MNMGKRLMCLILALILTAQFLPGQVMAAQTQEQWETVLEEQELLPADLLAGGISGYALGADGKVLLKYGAYVDWIDRLDLTGADYALNFYHWLEANANVSGALADYERNTTILNSNGLSYYVYKVVTFEEEKLGSVLELPQAERMPKAKEMAAVRAQQNNAVAAAHINAVFHAFDRDHPEVFWLSGASNVLNSYSYGYDSQGEVYYSQSIYFLLKSNTFDIRGANYRGTLKIKDAIAQRDNAVSKILEKAADGTRYEKIRELNRILTTINGYNTNLGTAGSDAHECISALLGQSGASGPVCEGYARAFKVLCDKLEIPCTLVDGFAKSSASHSGEAHMWNYVQMEDGNWYAVDVTWNDPTVNGITAANSGHEVESFLLVGGKSLVNGMKFLESHPVSNTVSSNGVAFTNGPVLADASYLSGLYIPATGMYLNYTSAQLNVGEYVDLSATLIPEEATETVVWTSGDSSVASVSSNGRVTAVAPGTVSITATAGSCTASCTVTVKKPAPIYTLPLAKSLTYQGQLQTLAEAGTVTNGTLEYSLDGAAYSQQIPQGKAAGSYTVYYRIKNLDNHITQQGKLTTVIAPKSLTAKLNGFVSKVYDGTTAVPADHGLSIQLTGVIAGDDVKATADYAYDSAEVGTTLVTASGIMLTGADRGNYVLTAAQASAYVGNITALDVCSHEYTKTEGKKAESCTEKGYTGDTVCQTCGVVIAVGNEITAKGHMEMVISAVPADCTNPGKTQGIRCGECGIILKAQSVVPPLEHDFVKGVCRRCNAIDDTYTEPTEPPTEPPTQPTQPTEPEAPTEPEKPDITEKGYRRLWGNDRYQTAFAIANEMKRLWNVDKFDSIILANSENFADALAGSYLAAVKKAPIIIGKLKYANVVCDYVNSNLKKDGIVYVLGGEGAVPEAMLSGITVTTNVDRLAGNDRYVTNLAILEAAGVAGKDILVATGQDFADSLSASATGLPILLVNGKPSKTLSDAQKEFLANVEGKIYIIGGESAVPASMVEQIETASGKKTERIAGGSRYETSVKIAQEFLGDSESAVVAYASTFPDGLCGGPLAYAVGAPLILTKDGKSEAPDYTKANDITSGYVLGADGLISDGFAEKLF